MQKIQLLAVALLFILNSATAQTLKQFPEGKTEFLTALDSFMNATKVKKNKIVFEAFNQNAISGQFSDNQLADIREVANQMLGLKMTASTYFESYLHSLNMMIASGQSNKSGDYLNTLRQLAGTIKSNNKPSFKDFTNFATNLFEKNALRFAKSGSIWLASTDNYSIIYKNNTPQITFAKLDLMGLRKNDTIHISETAGTYYPIKEIWRGKKAKVTWAYTKIGEEVYCIFDNYVIETKAPGYDVDTVTLYYPDYFPQPLKGSFKDRIIAGTKKKGHSYPRFSSFTKVMEISFLIRQDERVVSDAAAVSIYHGQDSIYHPRIGFKFDVDARLLSLRRGQKGIEKAPFYNSYHKFEINAEGIDWQIDSDSIEIGKAKKVGAKRDVTLESIAYYNADRYRRYQNIASFHPLT